jgi:hypothetical protein
VSKTISVVVRNTYILETGFLPNILHQRLKIALAHDNVSISNTHLLTGISQEGAYAIDWPDFQDFPVAKATAVIQVTPFNATNSNCKTCEEFAQVVAEDDTITAPYGLQEGAEYSLDLSTNDSICCFPAEWSLVSYNADYLDSAAVSDAGILTVTMGTGLVGGNNILLATYRITCPNGDYDDANVYGDVDGSIEGCFGPVDLSLDTIAPTAATAIWTDPVPAPDSYDWALYIEGDLVTVIQSGNVLPGVEELFLTGLDASTDYVLILIGQCEFGDASPVQLEFTTSESAESCGQYQLEMDNGTPDRDFASVTYINCDGNSANAIVINTETRIICALQTDPGNPVEISTDSPFVSYDYLGLC